MEDKNYYDWLEVSPKASPEVIEKAYKALVRKYHPDLQEGNKQEAEEIMKKINVAYDVLSDENKRAKYDEELAKKYGTQQNTQETKSEYSNHNNSQNSSNQTNDLNYKQQFEFEQKHRIELEKQRQAELERQRQLQQQAELEYQRQVEAARQQAYHDAYIQDLKNRGYRIRYKKSFKDYVRVAKVIVAFVLFCVIVWYVPFTHKWIIDFYNDNEILQFIVNIFI